MNSLSFIGNCKCTVLQLTPFASMVLRKDDSLSERDDKWLTQVKREPYLLHVKDNLVDFEKEQAIMPLQGSSHTPKVFQSTINKYI